MQGWMIALLALLGVGMLAGGFLGIFRATRGLRSSLSTITSALNEAVAANNEPPKPRSLSSLESVVMPKILKDFPDFNAKVFSQRVRRDAVRGSPARKREGTDQGASRVDRGVRRLRPQKDSDLSGGGRVPRYERRTAGAPPRAAVHRRLCGRSGQRGRRLQLPELRRAASRGGRACVRLLRHFVRRAGRSRLDAVRGEGRITSVKNKGADRTVSSLS